MEIWKDVKGYEGLYQVSNKGNVKAYPRTSIGGFGAVNYRPEHYMKQYQTKIGYLTVRLSKNQKGKNITVHRLVAEAFLDNPENKITVNHINGIKNDNNLINLEWATYKENNNHAYENGLNTRLKGKDHPFFGGNNPKMIKVKPKQIRCYCTKNDIYFDTIIEAAIYAKRPRTVLVSMLNGKRTNTTSIAKV